MSPLRKYGFPALAGLSWWAIASLTIALHNRTGMQILLWLPSAVAVGALYFGWRRHRLATLAALAVGGLAVGLLQGDSLGWALAFVVANLIGAVVTARIGRQVLGGRRLERLSLKQMVGLLLAAVAGALVSAAVMLPWMPAPLLERALGWMMAQVLAVTVGFPVICYVRSWAPGALFPTRRPDWFLTTIAALFGLAFLVMAERGFLLGPLMIAGLALAVVRYEQLGATAAVLAFGLAAMVHSIGGGPPAAFIALPRLEDGLILQADMLLMLATGVPIATLLMTNGRISAILRRRNAAMRENIRLLRMTEDIARIGRWRYYPKTQTQDWSREMFRMNGLDPAMGRDPGNIRYLLPDGGAELFGNLSHHARDKAAYQFEYRIRTPQHDERILKLQGRNEFDDKGELACMFGVVIDVTDHRQRQDQLDRERTRAMRLAAEAQHLAQTDALTGLANRRRSIEQLEKCIALCDGKSHSLAVIVFDIDHFKHVNDRHGHQGGDEVLVRVAEILRSEARANDLIGRVGGEEFLWLLPEAGEPVARAAALRLRAAIEGKSGEGGRPAVTASLGYALWQDGDDAGGLLARADKALYAAKDAGRNKVQRAA